MRDGSPSAAPQNKLTAHLTKTHLAINDGFGEVKFADHAQRDGTTAGLGVIELTLDKNGIDSLLLGEDLRGAGPSGSTADDGDLVLHAERRSRSGRLDPGSAPDEGGGGEGGDRCGRGEKDGETDLHGV